jgi:hypothetical protein
MNRKPRPLPSVIPKTLLEIREIARMRQEKAIAGLTCRDLEVLLFELNRTRYELREQDSFIRFYMAVIEAVRDCRVAEKSPFEKPKP